MPERFCPSCGTKQLADDQRFCHACGAATIWPQNGNTLDNSAQVAKEKASGPSVADQPKVSTTARFSLKAAMLAFALVAGLGGAALVYALTGGNTDDVTVTLPNGQEVTADNEKEAIIVGFTAGCESNYSAQQCRCLGEALDENYSTDELQSAGSRGPDALNELLEDSTGSSGCFGDEAREALGGVTARTAPEILEALFAQKPNFCEGHNLDLHLEARAVALRGPEQQPDGIWLVECVEGWFASTDVFPNGFTSYVCAQVDSNTLEVKFIQQPSGERIGLHGQTVFGRSCLYPDESI